MTTEDTQIRIGSKVQRPWGSYKLLVHRKDYSIKLLRISPGEETSLQRHSKRQELVILLEGSVTITHKGTTFTKDQSTVSYRIREYEWHKFAVPSDQDTPSVILEVGYGELDPDDFERKHDKYNRERKRGPSFIVRKTETGT